MTTGADLVVVDASVVVAALIDRSPTGVWAETVLSRPVAAPHLIDVEVTSTMRRLVATGAVHAGHAAGLLERFDELSVLRFPYSPFGPRIWALRESVTSYDAWYVAIAEAIGAPVATLDQRLIRVPGPTCEFLVP
jgi:predicted nucleic acid-binding protein